jgi:hypothetical protein
MATMNVTAANAVDVQATSWRLGTRITNALNTCCIIDLFDDAIADLLCVPTYTHGTSPRNYHNIMKVGVDPRFGGMSGESGYYGIIGKSHVVDAESSGWNCANRFFVYFPKASTFEKWIGSGFDYSQMASLSDSASPREYRLHPKLCKLRAFFLMCSSPTLKFRFGENAPIGFTEDNTISNQAAGYTEQPIPAKYVGLYGTITQGVNREWLKRVKKDPALFRQGLKKLAMIVAIVAVTILFALAPFNAAVLAIYGIVKAMQFFAQIIVPLCYEFKAKPVAPA